MSWWAFICLVDEPMCRYDSHRSTIGSQVPNRAFLCLHEPIHRYQGTSGQERGIKETRPILTTASWYANRQEDDLFMHPIHVIGGWYLKYG